MATWTPFLEIEPHQKVIFSSVCFSKPNVYQPIILSLHIYEPFRVNKQEMPFQSLRSITTDYCQWLSSSLLQLFRASNLSGSSCVCRRKTRRRNAWVSVLVRGSRCSLCLAHTTGDQQRILQSPSLRSGTKMIQPRQQLRQVVTKFSRDPTKVKRRHAENLIPCSSCGFIRIYMVVS